MRMPCSLREQGLPPQLSWRHRGTGTARKGGPCTDMPVLQNANHRNGLWRGRINTWKYASFRSIAANQSMWASWTEVCSRRADPRLVLTHHLSWVQWSKGCKTPSSYRLEGPALLHPSPVGLRSLHARQGHLPPSLKWSGRPWTWECAGRTESHSRVWWSDGAKETDWEALARNRTSCTNRTTDVPAVGQQGGMQGPGPGVSLPVRSGSACVQHLPAFGQRVRE